MLDRLTTGLAVRCDAGAGACMNTLPVGETSPIDAVAVAEQAGWHRTREGVDVCPDCWADYWNAGEVRP